MVEVCERSNLIPHVQGERGEGQGKERERGRGREEEGGGGRRGRGVGGGRIPESSRA